MATGKDKNYASVWFWMFAMLVAVIPCIGWLMILVWAFVGENESRKNYFRALIAWYSIIAVVWLGAVLAGLWPQIQKQIESRIR
ncbi:MAG TPA: hypothetical protein VJW76_04890 [Verrucomicrobiae bacterium]|nr:hypothetical protein [Verrucomicrobiae bacterium]